MKQAPAPPLRLDDLQYKGLMLYQRADLPCFTQDAVLLADFATLRPEDTAVDIGAGTGALAILSHARTGARFACIEKEPALCALLRGSIAYNRLERHVEVHELDWADAPAALGYGAFTAALCNPPYFGGGVSSGRPARALARTGEESPLPSSEAPLTAAGTCAARLLQNGGRLFLCYPARQLTQALYALHAAGLEPKRLRLAAQNAEKAPYLALLECKKGGKPGVVMEPLLCLRDEAGRETQEYRRVYHR